MGELHKIPLKIHSFNGCHETLSEYRELEYHEVERQRDRKKLLAKILESHHHRARRQQKCQLLNFHPSNLLVENTDCYYQSSSTNKFECKERCRDWIIFEIDDDETKCNPKWLKIKNYPGKNGMNGLKEIRLSFQYSGNDKWIKKQTIKDIYNNHRGSQWFKLFGFDHDQQKDEKLKLIKLNINKNHGAGWDTNIFYSLSLWNQY